MQCITETPVKCIENTYHTLVILLICSQCYNFSTFTLIDWASARASSL